MNYYIPIKSGNKAKNDIDTLMKQNDFINVSVNINQDGKINKFLYKFFTMFKLFKTIHKGDTLIIQYPFKKFYEHQCRIAHWKGAKVITLIHDLGTFRRHKLTANQEIIRLSHSDYIIAHNPTMMQWLINNGCKKKIVSLDIFDYLAETNPKDSDLQSPYNHIVYAGGFNKRKNMFIYQLDEIMDGCKVDLYGNGKVDDDVSWKNVRFNGPKPSDEFVACVEGHWGLVWDGDSVDECSGQWGEYLKINNPHKTSFYLRANLPVIVWKQSAMAPFILKNNLGISINSLKELPEVLNKISDEDYKKIRISVINFKQKLQDGYFFIKALNEIERLS